MRTPTDYLVVSKYGSQVALKAFDKNHALISAVELLDQPIENLTAFIPSLWEDQKYENN